MNHLYKIGDEKYVTNNQLYRLTDRNCDALGVYLPNGEFAVLKGSRVTIEDSTDRLWKRHPGTANTRFDRVIKDTWVRTDPTRPHSENTTWTITTTEVFPTAARAASTLTGDIRGSDAWKPIASYEVTNAG